MKTLRAVAYVRRMRGGAQSRLMTASDGCDYVVKFRANPQGNRVLANELLATQLALHVGLPVPEPAIIDVDPEFLRDHRGLDFDFGTRSCAPDPGLQFGSRFISSGNDTHSGLQLCTNLRAFAGMLAFDKWTGQIDARQTIYTETGGNRSVAFIDLGYAFGATEWKFFDNPLSGLSLNCRVYESLSGWDDFEPWLTRIENLSKSFILEAAGKIPPDWYDGAFDELAELIEGLNCRRREVRNLISNLITRKPDVFRNWHEHRLPVPHAPSLLANAGV